MPDSAGASLGLLKGGTQDVKKFNHVIFSALMFVKVALKIVALLLAATFTKSFRNL